MGTRNSATRTAAATAARHGQKDSLDVGGTTVKDPPQKPRPRPTPISHRPMDSPANTEVDPSLNQRQAVSNELETHDEDNSGDIGYSGGQDDHDGSADSNLHGDDDSDDGDYRGHGIDHDSGGSNDGDDSDRNIDKIPNQWGDCSGTAPALDEYGSEPEQYSPQDGELITSTTANTHSW